MKSMRSEGKNVIITGATSGIGKETVLSLAMNNSRIIMPVRNIKKGEKVKDQVVKKTGNPEIHLMECDLASFDSIRNFVAEFKKRFGELHLLINNAGTWERKRKETHDGIEMIFGINHLAPFLLTQLLLDELRADAPSRVINVSSMAHRFTGIDFDDPEGKKKFCSLRAYCQSKLANILFTRHLAKMLKSDGITVNSLHPGVVATGLYDKTIPLPNSVSGLFMMTPEKGAQTIIYLASSDEVNTITGEYFVKKKIKKPSAAARDDETAARLWEISRDYTGI